MKFDLPPLSEQQQERINARRDKFFDQTIEENNARIAALDTMAQIKKEIKFIERMMIIHDSL